MPRICLAAYFPLVLAFLMVGETLAVAQGRPGRDNCVAYQGTVLKGTSLPEKLLASDWENAVGCVVLALDDLKREIETKASADTWAQFVRATALLRIVIANHEGGKEVSQNDPNPAIRKFREKVTLDAASSLVYGARTADDNARVNATLVLGNVIDNQTVCVALDHLYDPLLGRNATSYHIRGRANLLGVVSVVAPWAYMENFDNIRALWKYMSNEMGPLQGRDDLKQTFEILANIDKRLSFQNEAEQKGQTVNKKASLKSAGLEACKFYRPNPNWSAGRLKY